MIGLLIATYLAFSFGSATFNISDWHVPARGACAGIMFLILFISLMENYTQLNK